MPAFVDTNVLVYSIDPTEPHKAAIAADILRRTDLLLSIQVLQEFAVQATNSAKTWALDRSDVAQFVRTWRRFPVIEENLDLLDRSLALWQRYKLSYWDSSIVAAALIGGADILLSEDMQHGQQIEGVTITNPFLPAA